MLWPYISGDIRQSPWFFVVGFAGCVFGVGIALAQGHGLGMVIGIFLIAIGSALVILAFSTVITWAPRHRRRKAHADRC